MTPRISAQIMEKKQLLLLEIGKKKRSCKQHIYIQVVRELLPDSKNFSWVKGRILKFFLFRYLFIWLCWIFVAAHRIFSCDMWDLVPQPGIEPAPHALGAWESQLVDHQGSSKMVFISTKAIHRMIQPNGILCSCSCLTFHINVFTEQK